MKRSNLAIAVAALAAAAGSAQAATYTYVGDTTGGPTYNRPVAGIPPPDMSAVGTDVAYSTFTFSVDSAGSYAFLSTATWDNFTFLYHDAFDPADPLTNAIVGNDDYGGIGTSGFTTDLATGTTYLYVTTGFANTDMGVFENGITGPGTVAAVPEPATCGLMAIGLGAIAFGRRQRTPASQRR